MKSITQFGEVKYTWENNFHPDNPNFMQIVFWVGWQKPDNRYSIGYKLEPSGKVKFVKYGKGNIEDEISNYGGDMKTDKHNVKVEDVPKGDLMKRKEGAKKVWQKIGFDRSLKKYEFQNYEDIGDFCYLKKGTEVFIGFDY